MRNDFTILIQGRLNRDCYDFYAKNYNKYNVVISTWSDTQFQIKNAPKNFTVLRINKPSNPGNQNSNLQIQSTLNGLKYVNTKYVVKVRGDEYYSNIEDMIRLVIKEENKIYTSPIYFRHPKDGLYHISDHLIVATKENMFKMFSDITYDNMVPIEVNLGVNFLKQVETDYNKEPLESMVKYFDIIDLNNHKPYMVTTNCCYPYKHTNFIPEKNNSISKIDMIFNSIQKQNAIIRNIGNDKNPNIEVANLSFWRNKLNKK